VGDIACYPDAHSGKLQRVEHWVHAQRQRQHVARAIMGHSGRFADVPFFWSAHFDTGLTYEGHVAQITEAELDGSVLGRDFTLRLTGAAQEKALIACNRDTALLRIESYWAHALTSAG
jgi:NADPH-dependent 2,4-dienoyl-CoA reductase/sulfur reductase-like enzyme